MIRINNLQKNFGTKKAVDIENYTIGQGDMLVLACINLPSLR
jgi:ABC-2 type transport system ATP-binding protein